MWVGHSNHTVDGRNPAPVNVENIHEYPTIYTPNKQIAVFQKAFSKNDPIDIINTFISEGGVFPLWLAGEQPSHPIYIRQASSPKLHAANILLWVLGASIRKAAWWTKTIGLNGRKARKETCAQYPPWN